MSTGLALLDKDDDLKTLFKRSDKALYQAKNTGRNKVVVGEKQKEPELCN